MMGQGMINEALAWTGKVRARPCASHGEAGRLAPHPLRR